jgi:DNA-binding MarR family transcriptional regulator
MLAMRTQFRGGGPALFRLVRFWSRRWANAGFSQANDPRIIHVQVLEAIDAAKTRGSASISAVADELGIDRSGASRMVSAAVAVGYVRKVTADDDARRAELAVSKEGAELLRAARVWQQDVFERLMADWSAADSARFAAYLERLANQTLTGGIGQ